MPLLRRALAATGVPSVIAGDELPLEAEPGVRPLLLLLRCALHLETLDEEAAVELLAGPLGGTDALGLRRLRRALWAAAHSAGEDSPPQPLAAALLDPRELTLIRGPGADAARRVAGLLALARQTAEDGNAHDVLWAVWHASGLAPAWQAVSAAGGSRGAAADRDLDAVCALFDAAARFIVRLPPGSASLFLDSMSGQEIPGDTLAGHAPDGDAVRILTAHRAKGLEWDVVVVAGVQEGIWPDLRMRSSLLGMDELMDAAAGVLVPGTGIDAMAAALAAKLLNEERRLFYVAVTRARRHLVVTASGSDDIQERPSRFLAELAGDDIEIEDVAGAAPRWLSLPSLTADLRRAAADPARPPALRRAAAAQLARLAEAGVRGAHPGQWYQLTELSDAGQIPAAADGLLVRLSPSQVESFHRCGLRWLLEVAAGAGSSDVIRHFGILIHAAAVLAATGADGVMIDERIDEIWHHLDFGSPWYSEKERERARVMVRKFLAWHAGQPEGTGGGRAEAARAGRRGGDHRAGGPAGAGLRRPGHRRGPEDRIHPGAGHGPGPAPPARRVPAGRPARRVRAVRPDRAGRRGAGPGGQGEPVRPGPGAATGAPVRRPGTRLGSGPGRDRGGGHGRPVVRGAGEPGVP